jgi:hypothetical protein
MTSSRPAAVLSPQVANRAAANIGAGAGASWVGERVVAEEMNQRAADDQREHDVHRRGRVPGSRYGPAKGNLGHSHDDGRCGSEHPSTNHVRKP